jgi:hypothetical protein
VGPEVYRDIALCACGVAYRTRPASRAFRYSAASFRGELPAHRARMTRAAARLPRLDRALAILDVGAGHGLLHDAIVDAGVTPRRYVALEPSRQLARALKRRPGVQVIRGSVDELAADDRFDAIFVLATRLARDGAVIVQSNVFLEQTAYVDGRRIVTPCDLFGRNSLIMQWFQLEQYASFLSRFFSIAAMSKEDEPGGGFVATYVAHPGGAASEVLSRPDQAREVLRRLGS